MSTISNIASVTQTIVDQKTTKIKNTSKSEELLATSTVDITHKELPKEETKSSLLKVNTYKPDMEKVHAMKAETDRRMHELFQASIKGNTLKQLGGYRGIIDKLLSGEASGLEIDVEISTEDIAKAKEEVAPDGYWSPEKTAERFIDFAKALSGGNKEKADLLIDAFKKGYAQAEELWGGELPEISQKTYDLTLEKFDQWKNGDQALEVQSTEEEIIEE